MTRRQRLSLGARILASIDARRKRTRDNKEFLAVEQAIVARELAELEGLADQNSAVEDSRFRRSVETGRCRSANSDTRALRGSS
jgi:hypothetical protein